MMGRCATHVVSNRSLAFDGSVPSAQTMTSAPSVTIATSTTCATAFFEFTHLAAESESYRVKENLFT